VQGHFQPFAAGHRCDECKRSIRHQGRIADLRCKRELDGCVLQKQTSSDNHNAFLFCAAAVRFELICQTVRSQAIVARFPSILHLVSPQKLHCCRTMNIENHIQGWRAQPKNAGERSNLNKMKCGNKL
jgi:hypothetical protein